MHEDLGYRRKRRRKTYDAHEEGYGCGHERNGTDE